MESKVGIIRFFLIFILAVFLNASYDFSNFDTKFDSSTKIEKRVFHKELKELYIKASTSKDNKEKIAALERLIHSSKDLGLNYQGYENELKELGGSYDRYLSSLKPKKVEKSVEERLAEIAPVRQESQELIEPKVASKEPIKNLNPAKETKATKSLKTDEIVDTSKRLNLLSVEKIAGGVVLNFNRPVAKSEMKQFALLGDSYRNVIDFKAGNYAKTSRIKDHGISEIRIAQFDKDTTRVVFTHSSKFDIDIDSSSKSLTISSKNFSKTIQKVAATSSQNKPSSKATPVKKAAKPKLIVIDPGHGGKDPGAMGGGLREKDIVLNIGKDLGTELSKRGYKVLYTRSTDKFINLKSRTAFANRKNADLFISIHINAGPNKKSTLSGIETFFLSPARSERSKNVAALENKGDIEDMNYFSKETYLNFLNREKIIASNKLAIDIQKHILNRVQSKYGLKDSGVREAPFWVLVGATMPAILVEAGYITSSKDSKHLGKRAYQKDVANGIANGIDTYFAKN